MLQMPVRDGAGNGGGARRKGIEPGGGAAGQRGRHYVPHRLLGGKALAHRGPGASRHVSRLLAG